jgi:hypothetical protein
MAKRHFRVDEVEALIPALERLFARILQLRVGLRAVEQKLERAGVEVSDDSPGGEDVVDESRVEGEDVVGTEDFDLSGGAALTVEPPAVRQARAVFRGFYEALSDGLEQIRALGGEVKDLDMGLVDFLGRRDNEDILLCWRLGEKRIEYWHALDAGFANRRPLEEPPTPTTSRLD